MKTVINATSKHISDAKFISQSLAFLANLCMHGKACEAVIPTKMIDSIHSVMRTHRLDAQLLMRALRALENIAYSSQPLRDHMKSEKVIEEVEEVKTRHNGNSDLTKQCKGVIDAILRVRTELGDSFIGMMHHHDDRKLALRQKIGEPDKRIDGLEFPLEYKNMLLAGQLIKKHSNKANPRVRHVYVTADLKWLIWKDPRKEVDPKQRMKTFKIGSVESGRCTKQLQRKKTFGGYLAKEECSFAVLGRERSVDLEANTEAERDKWVTALRHLVAHIKANRQAASKFTSR